MEDFITATDRFSVLREGADGLKEISSGAEALSKGLIRLSGEVNSFMADAFTEKLIYAENNPDIATINIIINSPGGSVPDGLAIYDQIQDVKKPLNVICTASAYSMGAILLCGGPAGHRYILPHSKVMIHEPLIPQTGGNCTAIVKTAESIKQTKQDLIDILAKHTGKTVEEITEAISYDHFLTAEESIEFGLCDKILADPIASLIDVR